VLTFSVLATAEAGTVLRFKTGDVTLADKTSSAFLPGSEGTHNFVVQFKGVITKVDQRLLKATGAKTLRYVPDDALVIRVDANLIPAILKSENVRGVVAFSPDWKLSSDFGPSSIFSASNSISAHIRLFPGAKNSAAVSEISKISGVTVVEAKGRYLSVQIPRRSLSDLAQIESVEWIQTQPVFETMVFDSNTPPDPNSGMGPQTGDYKDLSGTESGTAVMGFKDAWARGFTGRGQILSMADTGLDTGDAATIHPDFNMRIPKGYYKGLYSKSWEDPMGHGTHVSGSIFGSGFQSGGILKGGSFEGSLIPVSMWSPMMSNIMPPNQLSELYLEPHNDGARVSSNSWGTGRDFGSYDSFAAQVDEFMATHPDILLLFAAGNSGVDHDRDGRIDPNSIGSPGTAKNVLTVGASENDVPIMGRQKMHKDMSHGSENWGVEPLASDTLSNNPNGLGVFSSRGPTQDGRIKPDIVAPGTNILSTRSKVPGASPLWGEYNKDYVWAGGTSMATPLTAGAIGVLRQYLVEDRKIADPSAALMKAVIMHTADDMFPGQYGQGGKAAGQELLTTRPNSDEGYGRVDISRATRLSDAMLIDEKTGIATGDVKIYPVKVDGQKTLTAMMVYTDAAATPTASKALVNDLDLVLVNLATNQETSLNDHTNNAEMVSAAVGAGNYEVRVKGLNVPQGPSDGKQPFALVITVR
jgi:serine protease AprX